MPKLFVLQCDTARGQLATYFSEGCSRRFAGTPQWWSDGVWFSAASLTLTSAWLLWWTCSKRCLWEMVQSTEAGLEASWAWDGTRHVFGRFDLRMHCKASLFWSMSSDWQRWSFDTLSDCFAAVFLSFRGLPPWHLDENLYFLMFWIACVCTLWCSCGLLQYESGRNVVSTPASPSNLLLLTSILGEMADWLRRISVDILDTAFFSCVWPVVELWVWLLLWGEDAPSNASWDFLWTTLKDLIPSHCEADVCLPVAPLCCCCLMLDFSVRIAVMFSVLNTQCLLCIRLGDVAGSLWDSEGVWCRTLLNSGWVKSSKTSWSSTSCLTTFEGFEMGMEWARLSLATGEGCFPPWSSELVPWHWDVGEGLSRGVGTIRVGETLSFASGWFSEEGSLHCEAGRWRESLGLGFSVGEEFGSEEGEMMMLGFTERDWGLNVLGFVLGSVEALSPWFLCWQALVHDGWLDVLKEQTEANDLRS